MKALSGKATAAYIRGDITQPQLNKALKHLRDFEGCFKAGKKRKGK